MTEAKALAVRTDTCTGRGIGRAREAEVLDLYAQLATPPLDHTCQLLTCKDRGLQQLDQLVNLN